MLAHRWRVALPGTLQWAPGSPQNDETKNRSDCNRDSFKLAWLICAVLCLYVCVLLLSNRIIIIIILFHYQWQRQWRWER